MVPPPSGYGGYGGAGSSSSGGSGGGGNGMHPDKRTTAYENIFGRPTAKPKGPSAYPPSMGPMMPPQPQPGAAPYHVAGQPQAYGADAQPQMRYSNGSAVGGGVYLPPGPGAGAGSSSAAPYHVPGPYGQSQADSIDRRSSVTPSIASQQDPLFSYPGAPAGPSSIGEAYPAPSPSPAPAPSYNQYYSRAPAASPPLSQRPMQPDGNTYRKPSLPSAFQRPDSYGSVGGGSAEHTSPPQYAPPRLPSFDLGSSQGAGQSEEMWFSNGGAANTSGGNPSATHGSGPSQTSSNGTAVPSNYAPSFATRTSTTIAEDTPRSPASQSIAVFPDGDKEESAGAFGFDRHE